MNAAPKLDSGVFRVLGTSRLVIVGGPRTGKSWHAEHVGRQYGVQVRHTDDLIATHAWSEASEEVATWFDAPGAWIVEGCATARALRKWIAAHPKGTPCDAVALMWNPRAERKPGHWGMAKGVQTVWLEIEFELRHRGVLIEVLP